MNINHKYTEYLQCSNMTRCVHLQIQYNSLLLFIRTVSWPQWSWVWSRSSSQQWQHWSWTKLEGKPFWLSQVFSAKSFHLLITLTMRYWHCFPIHKQGIAMTISTTAFGIYFYLMSIHHSSTTMLGAPEDHGDLAWLALGSMAVFIAGKIIEWKSVVVVVVVIVKNKVIILHQKFVTVFRFCSRLGSNPMAGHVRNFPCQSEGLCQRCLRPYQLGHGLRCHQNFPKYDGECWTV